MIHRRGDGDVDVLRPAPTTAQIHGPAANEGIRDLLRLEQHRYKPCREPQMQEVGGVGRIVQLGEAICVVNLRHRERAIPTSRGSRGEWWVEMGPFISGEEGEADGHPCGEPEPRRIRDFATVTTVDDRHVTR